MAILPQLSQLDPMVREFLGATPMDSSTRQEFLLTSQEEQLYVATHWRPKRGFQEGNYSGLVRSLMGKAQLARLADPLTATTAADHHTLWDMLMGIPEARSLSPYR